MTLPNPPTAAQGVPPHCPLPIKSSPTRCSIRIPPLLSSFKGTKRIVGRITPCRPPHSSAALYIARPSHCRHRRGPRAYRCEAQKQRRLLHDSMHSLVVDNGQSCPRQFPVQKCGDAAVAISRLFVDEAEDERLQAPAIGLAVGATWPEFDDTVLSGWELSSMIRRCASVVHCRRREAPMVTWMR